MARFGCVIINQLDRCERYGHCAFVIVVMIIIAIIIIIIISCTFVYSVCPFVNLLTIKVAN